MTKRRAKAKDDACRFLKKLNLVNGFTFQTFDDCADKNRQLACVFNGSLEEHFTSLEQLNDRGAGIFVTVNQTDLTGRKTENIVRVRAVFADLDGAPLKPVREFGLEPHIIIESSPHRWHAYWLCSQLPLDEFENIQKIIASRFNSDPVINDLPRVMRLPGFYHCKKDPFLVRIENMNDRKPYQVDEIFHWFGSTAVQSKTKKQAAGRNNYLFSRACTMRKYGMSEGEIRQAISAVNQTADTQSCSNFNDGPLPEKEVAAICKSAMHDRYKAGQNASGDSEYLILENQLARRELTSKGQRDTVLSNFTGEIVEDICRDDGAGEVREYLLKGRLHNGKPLPTVAVPAGRYNAMNWVADAWGAQAHMKVGLTSHQHAAVAIQHLSSPLQRRIFTHTGWRQIDGAWHFLNGAGAITATGFMPDIEVELGRGLKDYQLPDPQSGDIKQAVQASIEFLAVAPDSITWPLLAAVFRSVLAEWLPAELSVFVVGPTGTFKTCLATLCTAHFGQGWTASNTPASWSSTPNALERMAFTAKDHVLLIDDFAPNGTYTDIRKLHATAERVIRAQGNQSGRYRMRADSTLAGSLPPRGLIIATGEDMPKGQSLQARMVLVQISPGDVNVSRLTNAQANAESGTYARVMAAFTQRLARLADAGKLSSRLDTRSKELRAEAIKGIHTRTPDNIASLMVGVEEFLDFSVEAGAIADVELTELRASAWESLNEQAKIQVNLVSGTDPASRFVSLIAAAVSAKRANIAATNGGKPDIASALGWDCRGSGEHRYMVANGPVIGWLEGDDLYLEAEEAMACAKHLARDQGNELAFTEKRIQKSLQEAGLLKSSEPERNTVRKTLDGRRRYVLHMSSERVLGIDFSTQAPRIEEDVPF